MSLETRLELSYYQETASINESHKVFLVQHRETKKFFVKKVLTKYNLSVYRALQDNPIPGLPQIYLLHEEDGTLTVIEEYVSGYTLEEIMINRGPINEREICGYMSGLCDILAEMHSRTPAIIHRDIKPSNVMITANSRVILLDFNAARENIVKEEDTELLGTKGYAAPEQYGFGSSSPRTDIYALGMLMNSLLWGDFHRDIYPSATLGPVIQKCIQINPDDRYSDVLKLKEALPHFKRQPVIFAKDSPDYLSENSAKGNPDYRPEEIAKKKYYPPGFRTGKTWKMIVASLVYIGLAAFCIFPRQDMDARESLIIGFAVFLYSLLFIACMFNYADIRKIIPFSGSSKKIFRAFGTILFLVLAIFIDVILIGVLEWIFIR